MSDITTKLITMANNIPAMADAVNATKATVSGSVVSVDDVLNVKHPLRIQLSSKNLIDFVGLLGEDYTYTEGGLSSIVENGNIITTGTITASGYVYGMKPNRDTVTKQNIFLPAGTYTAPAGLQIQLHDADTATNTNYGKTFTIEKELQLVWFYIAYSGVGKVINTSIPLMLVKGTTAPTEYTPYTTDFTDSEVYVYGKNLFNVIASTGENSSSTYNAEENYIHSTGAVGRREYVYVNITDVWHILNKANQTFTISFDMRTDIDGVVRFYTLGKYRIYLGATGSQREFQGTTEWQRYSVVVEPNKLAYLEGEDGALCRLSWYGTAYGSGINPYIRNIQIEISNNETEYKPYLESQTATSNSSGKVTGLTAVYPSMTIVPDSDAVTVGCTYFPESATNIYMIYQQLKQAEAILQRFLYGYLGGFSNKLLSFDYFILQDATGAYLLDKEVE